MDNFKEPENRLRGLGMSIGKISSEVPSRQNAAGLLAEKIRRMEKEVWLLKSLHEDLISGALIRPDSEEALYNLFTKADFYR